jgi:hypothetical protein
MTRALRPMAPQNAAQREIEAAFAAITPWAREHFGLSEDWQPNLRTFWDPKINVSKGGWFAVPNRVNRTRTQVLAISINGCHHKFPMGDFWEYPHYVTDPEIGTFFDCWQRQLWAVVAHELAHAVEFADVELKMIDHRNPEARNRNTHWLMMKRGDHADRFQWIYRELRRAWINNGAWRKAEEPPMAARTHEPAWIKEAPPVIRVFVGSWASGGFASGRFETVGAFTGGFRVKTSQGTRDLMVEAPNWVTV